ncbi:winged helix-turn-helix transcriptional regulator [Bacillus paranthracis]|uniref:winged helix-turn-helix transcriptional regulator n=1 Tax=Bacillus paranthracis TaxID=2026186 RepID=UPI0021D3B1B7|nr:winged helix-turn-helix transcriptional regulator [Bacillus paranthracis]MCU5202343.1 winged helix-turn-helix transcriptional regulator [Bacillus paranthracis]HDR7766551.1 MarR family transcriptional regulator [Bacillus paranthracis]
MIKLELLVSNNPYLLVRQTLIPLKEEIINRIDQHSKGTIFFYDFSEIKGINTSCVDEIIAKVMKHLISSKEEKFLILTNLMEDMYEHRFNIDYSLSRLEVGIVEQMPDGEANFIGKISDSHRELLEMIYEQKRVTARAIADQTGKKLSLVSTHLNKLFSLRLINRREDQLLDGGRQFVYESLF